MSTTLGKKRVSLYKRAVDLKRLQFIIDAISILDASKSTILDLGCGNGNISHEIGNKGYTVHGIDISPKAILKAKTLNNMNHVKFFVKDAEELTEEGIQYEAIICSEVLEHLVNPKGLLKIIYRLLKKNGILIVTVPNGNGPREVLMTRPMQWVRKNNGELWNIISNIKRSMGYSGKTIQSDADDLDHIHFFSKKELLLTLKESNFKMIKFGKADFVEDVFPVSLFTKRIKFLQKIDCKIADLLPSYCTGGFHTACVKDVN